MLDLFKFFNKEKNSGNLAKERLQLVLVHDRANCSPELLELVREDILKVIAEHLDIDEKGLDIKITKTDDGTGKPALVANIPLKNLKR